MKLRIFVSAAASAALIAIPATKVTADAGDFIAGAIIGGIVGATAKNNKKRSRTTYRSSRPRLPVTQEGRLIQTSLNYFGFNAGAVDGQLGRRSRTAISNYQAHMGYPVTGQLSLYERDFLFTSYERAQAGGAVTMTQIAQHPMGARGLLHVYRDQLAGTTLAGVPNTVQGTVPGTVVTVPAVPTTTVVTVAPTPAPAAPQPQETTVAAAADAPATLPTFSTNTAQQSLASHCNAVSLLTNSNGGFTTLANMSDPVMTMSEQFCLARTYGIAKGEEMVSGMANVTPAQVTQQCASFGPAMSEQIAAVATQPMADVIRSTSAFVLSTGMSTNDLRSTAQVCLSSGYRTDDMDVAIGSTLLMVALGEASYGELIGHHLSQGFGVAKRPDLALPWYDGAVSAIEAGAPAVFAPGQPERTMLIKAASDSMRGGGGLPKVQPAAALPSFGATNN